MQCQICKSNEITFICKRCGQSFCSNHLIDTTKFVCKKHKIRYSDSMAKLFQYKCVVLPKTYCPRCGKFLILDINKTGEFFIKCCSCEYSSLEEIPKICHNHISTVLNHAKLQHLFPRSSKSVLCNNSLAKIPGKILCPNCFSKFLINNGSSNIDLLSNTYDCSSVEIIYAIKKTIAMNLILGNFDSDKNPSQFTCIGQNLIIPYLENLQTSGILEIESVLRHTHISRDQLISVILSNPEYISSFDKKLIISRKYAKTTFEEAIFKEEYFEIEKLAQNLNLPLSFVEEYLKCYNEKIKSKYIISLKKSKVIKKSYLQSIIKQKIMDGTAIDIGKLSSKLDISTKELRIFIFRLKNKGNLLGNFSQNSDIFIPNKPKIRDKLMIQEELEEKCESSEKLIINLEHEFRGKSLILNSKLSNYTENQLRNITMTIEETPFFSVLKPYVFISKLEPSDIALNKFEMEIKKCGRSRIGIVITYIDIYGKRYVEFKQSSLIDINNPQLYSSKITKNQKKSIKLLTGELPFSDQSIGFIAKKEEYVFNKLTELLITFQMQKVENKNSDDKFSLYYSSEQNSEDPIIIGMMRFDLSIKIRAWAKNEKTRVGLLTKITETFKLEQKNIYLITNKFQQKICDAIDITHNLVIASDYFGLGLSQLEIIPKLEMAYTCLERSYHTELEKFEDLLEIVKFLKLDNPELTNKNRNMIMIKIENMINTLKQISTNFR